MGFRSAVWKNPVEIPKHPLHHLKDQKCHKSNTACLIKNKNIFVVEIALCLSPLSRQKVFLEIEEGGLSSDDGNNVISFVVVLYKMQKTCLTYL